MRSFDFNKSSLTVSYPIGHAQLAIAETKTRKKKTKQKQRKTKITLPKSVRLTKTKLKAMLEYERVKETTKRVSKMRENSPNL